MISEQDIINRMMESRKGLSERDARDFLKVIAKYLQKLAREDKHELIELPYVGYLYKKLDKYTEKEKSTSPVYEKKWLRSIYEYGKPNHINYYISESLLKKKYNAETKEQLQEALDNPSFKK